MDEIKQFDLVKVTKKTKSRVANKAIPGSLYLVTGVYTNPNFGNVKLYLIDENCEPFVSTPSCVEKQYNVTEVHYESGGEKKKTMWQKVKTNWMTKTYVPVVLSHFYGHDGFPILFTRDKSAALVSDVRCAMSDDPKKFWLNVNYVHDDDIQTFMSSSLTPDSDKKNNPSGAFSVRIPVWYAKKNGLFK